MSKRTIKNSGRFQAQGLKLEKSEKWNQDTPISLKDGLQLIGSLKKQLSKNELLIRKDAFIKCENYITQANKNGGASSVIIKSFQCTHSERVDLEINYGQAFII